MQLLLVNPNMTTDMTDGLAKVARRAASTGTSIEPMTATKGFPYISSAAEAQVSGVIALEMIAAKAPTIDAAVIAAFGDPGLKAARELFDFPIVGMAEAAIMTANMLGETFAIVTFTPAMTPWFADLVNGTGLGARFVGFHTPDRQNIDIANVASTMREELTELACRAALEDGADVVILGGAPLAGLAAEIQSDVPAIVIDPISAAVRQAEALTYVAPEGASRGRFQRPPGKPSVGLEPTLAKWFASGAAPSGK